MKAPFFSRLTASILLCASFLLADAGVAAAQNPFLKEQAPRVIKEIQITGNTTTKEYVLRRELGFQEGDVYDDDALNDAWYRLEQLNFIAYVDIQVERSAPGEVILKIQIEEDNRFDWRPYLRWERRFDWLYGLSGQMINFRGRAETLWARAYAGHKQHLSLGWQNPWILGRTHLGVGVSGYYERYRFVYLPFRLEDAGGSLDLWHDLTKNLQVTGNYTYRGLTISESGSSLADQSISDPYLKAGLDYDSRDLRYYPSHGVHASALATLGAVGAGDLSSYSYFDLSLAGYQALPYLGILASRVSYRGTGDSLPVYERSYLGGPDTIRGVDFSSVRGDENFLATIELRRPVFLVPLREGRAVGLGFHAFVDWGTAWEAAQSISDAKMRHSGGIGLHLNLNTYNLRFEWAFSDHDGNSFIFADRFTF